jgi:hypothetical protein
MTVCERLGGDGSSPRVERYVNNRRDSQDAFARQKLHVSASTTASGITVLTESAVK